MVNKIKIRKITLNKIFDVIYILCLIFAILIKIFNS